MPSQILVKYISDTSIPADKRRNVANMINEGTMSEAAAVKGITSKYGEKYGKPEDTSAGGKAADLVKGVVNNANPMKAVEGAVGMLGKAAPTIGKGLAEIGKNTTPESIAAAKTSIAEDDALRGRENAATQALNAQGIVPSADDANKRADEAFKNAAPGMGAEALKENKETMVTEKENAVKQVQDINNPLRSAVGGATYEIGEEAVGGIKDVAEGVMDTGKSMLSGDNNEVAGVSKIGEGLTRTIMSPVSGIINAIPDNDPVLGDTGKNIKKIVGDIGGIPAEAVGGLTYNLAKFLNPNLTEEELQEKIVRPVKAATNLYLVSHPDAVKKGMKKAAEIGHKVVESMKKGAEDLGKSALSKTSGLNKGTIETVLENPKGFQEGKKVGADVVRENTMKELKTPIDTKIAELSSTGKAYDPIRNNGKTVAMPENYLKGQLQKSGLEIGPKGEITATAGSKLRSKADIAKVKEFYELYNKPQLTTNEFLNMRTDLKTMAKYEMGKTSELQALAKDWRKTVNKDLRPQVEGLEKLDTQYGGTIKQLKEVKDLIYDKKGNLKDNAVSSVNNLLGKGKEGKIAKIQKNLEGFDLDNFAKQIKIAKALEDIELSKGVKVGQYTHSAITGGAAVTGNLPVAAIAVLTHPSVLVPLLTEYAKVAGKSKAFVKALGEKVMSGKKPTGIESTFILDAIKETPPNVLQGIIGAHVQDGK